MVVAALQSHAELDTIPYSVPGAWVGKSGTQVFPSGSQYLLSQILELRSMSSKPPRRELLYNALVRHVTSYDHYQTGELSLETPRWKTTGTFLKMLALAPYLHELGVTHLVLLPVFATGHSGAKGSLGSPYAVRNPFELDEQLAELLPGVSIEHQARAMVEAMHLVGIKVVLEMVLRTASIDSDIVAAHPEWFYWVKETALQNNVFAAPVFTPEELDAIKLKIESHDRFRLPEPAFSYREMFNGVPNSIVHDGTGWLGVAVDGERLRIPGAFADWPPDDQQPAWSDVTYYKLHDHPDLSYMAYNTIRMFDERLEHPEYAQDGLWNELANVIPYYQHLLDIDGAMIDMGHALPLALRHRLLHRAREQHSEFVIYEESFELDAKISAQGVNAVVGYLPHASRRLGTLQEFTARCASHDLPIRYFGAVESHNTPRIGAAYVDDKASAVWRYVSLLPSAIPYVVAGFEMAETYPMNTGLDFTDEQRCYYAEHGLPLFDDIRLPWDNVSITRSMLRSRRSQENSLAVMGLLQDDDDLVIVADVPADCLAYVRMPRCNRQGVLVALNLGDVPAQINLDTDTYVDVAVGTDVMYTNHQITVQLPASSCSVIPILMRFCP